MIPNVEFKLIKNDIEKIAFNNKVTVYMENEKIYISCIELQIAYKEEILKTPKDIEDARHLRKVADQYLDNELLKKYSMRLHEFYR